MRIVNITWPSIIVRQRRRRGRWPSITHISLLSWIYVCTSSIILCICVNSLPSVAKGGGDVVLWCAQRTGEVVIVVVARIAMMLEKDRVGMQFKFVDKEVGTARNAESWGGGGGGKMVGFVKLLT
jgi:hypothetical protein